jgi:hypothetical protein
MADVAIHGGQRWRQRAGEDGGEYSEIFEYSVEPGGTIP